MSFLIRFFLVIRVYITVEKNLKIKGGGEKNTTIKFFMVNKFNFHHALIVRENWITLIEKLKKINKSYDYANSLFDIDW